MKVFLKQPAVTAATGVGKTGIYAGMANGTFPLGLKVGAKTRVWDSDEISQWQAEQIANRETEVKPCIRHRKPRKAKQPLTDEQTLERKKKRATQTLARHTTALELAKA